MIEIAPSLLSADSSRLGEQVRDCFEAGVRRIHVDVMDGQFVPNITVGPMVVEALRPLADEYSGDIETHLMIVQPERFLTDFSQAGADIIIVHVETCPMLHRCVWAIRELGRRPVVALNPGTHISAIEEIVTEVDQVLVMTVDPGFGGQDLVPSTVGKIGRVCRMLADRGLEHIPVEVDGGIHQGTIGYVARAGASIAVSGTGVFNDQGTVADNLKSMFRAAEGP